MLFVVVSVFIGCLVPKNMSFIPGGKVDIEKTWKCRVLKGMCAILECSPSIVRVHMSNASSRRAALY